LGSGKAVFGGGGGGANFGGGSGGADFSGGGRADYCCGGGGLSLVVVVVERSTIVVAVTQVIAVVVVMTQIAAMVVAATKIAAVEVTSPNWKIQSLPHQTQCPTCAIGCDNQHSFQVCIHHSLQGIPACFYGGQVLTCPQVL
jgi:hypothetical protein